MGFLRLRRCLALLLVVSVLNGCYAPSWAAPKRPYSPKDRSIFIQTYRGAYDTSVGLQVIPIPLIWAFGWKKKSKGREITLNIAMPIALVGMIALGTIAAPFVFIGSKG